jgi:hypothetical protein
MMAARVKGCNRERVSSEKKLDGILHRVSDVLHSGMNRTPSENPSGGDASQRVYREVEGAESCICRKKQETCLAIHDVRHEKQKGNCWFSFS